jgi:hypothetical protein
MIGIKIVFSHYFPPHTKKIFNWNNWIEISEWVVWEKEIEIEVKERKNQNEIKKT